MICTEKCWTRVECPEHDELMWPRGRSAPLGIHLCCPNDSYRATNPCHLFSEHDSDRHYSDPAGWAAHEAACHDCSPEADYE